MPILSVFVSLLKSGFSASMLDTKLLPTGCRGRVSRPVGGEMPPLQVAITPDACYNTPNESEGVVYA